MPQPTTFWTILFYFICMVHIIAQPNNPSGDCQIYFEQNQTINNIQRLYTSSLAFQNNNNNISFQWVADTNKLMGKIRGTESIGLGKFDAIELNSSPQNRLNFVFHSEASIEENLFTNIFYVNTFHLEWINANNIKQIKLIDSQKNKYYIYNLDKYDRQIFKKITRCFYNNIDEEFLKDIPTTPEIPEEQAISSTSPPSTNNYILRGLPDEIPLPPHDTEISEDLPCAARLKINTEKEWDWASCQVIVEELLLANELELALAYTDYMYELSKRDKRSQLLLLETLDYKFNILIALEDYDAALKTSEEMLPLYKRFFKRFPEQVFWLNVHRSLLYERNDQTQKAKNIRENWEKEWKTFLQKDSRKDSVIYFKLAHQIAIVHAVYPDKKLEAEKYFVVASNCPLGLIKASEGQDFYLINSQAHAALFIEIGEQTGKRLIHEQSYQYGQMLMARSRNYQFNSFMDQFFGNSTFVQVVERIYFEMRRATYPNNNTPDLHPLWKSMADYYMEIGEYVGARLLYRECSYYHIDKEGHKNINIAEIYWEMAVLYHNKGDISKSNYYYKEALDIVASIEGIDSELYQLISCDQETKTRENSKRGIPETDGIKEQEN